MQTVFKVTVSVLESELTVGYCESQLAPLSLCTRSVLFDVALNVLRPSMCRSRGVSPVVSYSLPAPAPFFRLWRFWTELGQTSGWWDDFEVVLPEECREYFCLSEGSEWPPLTAHQRSKNRVWGQKRCLHALLCYWPCFGTCFPFSCGITYPV